MSFETFDDYFFLSLATILSASFALSVRYCFKSKCSEIEIAWNGIKIVRTPDLERQETI